MKSRTWLHAGLTTVLLTAGAAYAQTKSPTATDIGASPAEERSSAGAIVFEDSMPRAHQKTFGVRDSRAEVAAVGQGVMEATLAEMRQDEQGPNTRALGGPPEPQTKGKARPKRAVPKATQP